MYVTDIVPCLGDNPSVNAKAERGKRKREGDSDDATNVPKKPKKNVQHRSKTVILLGSDGDDAPELPPVPRVQREVRQSHIIWEILTIPD